MDSRGLGAAVFLALVAATPSQAQPSPRWNDPTNSFSISFAPSEWRELPTQAGFVLNLEANSRTHALQCSVLQMAYPPESASLAQPELNAMLRSTTREQVQATMAGELLTAYEFGMVGGVATVLQESAEQQHRIQRTTLTFATPGSAHATVHRLECINTAEVRAAVAGRIDALFESLQIGTLP